MFFSIFFDTPELIKIVLPEKFYKILGSRHTVPVGTRNLTKKVSRVTYNTGRCQRVPLFSFFGIARLTFEKKNSQRVPLQFFWSFATEWMLQIPEVLPFQFFEIVRLFQNFFINFKGFIITLFRSSMNKKIQITTMSFGSVRGFLLLKLLESDLPSDSEQIGSETRQY